LSPFVDDIILRIDADIQVIVVVRQIVGETRVVQPAPDPIIGKIHQPGITGSSIGVAGRDRDTLKSAVFGGGNAAIERDGTIRDFWRHERGAVERRPRALCGHVEG
jgi:hypothetical protein